jgi:hypothetical protein
MRQCSEAESCTQKDCVHIKKHEGNPLWACWKWEGYGEEGCYYNKQARCLRIDEYWKKIWKKRLIDKMFSKEYLDSIKEGT